MWMLKKYVIKAFLPASNGTAKVFFCCFG